MNTDQFDQSFVRTQPYERAYDERMRRLQGQMPTNRPTPPSKEELLARRQPRGPLPVKPIIGLFLSRFTDYARANPGLTTTEIINSIEHHYATPQRASAFINRCFRQGRMSGLRTERKKNGYRVYPVDES